jgi:LytTr DNA-binding domain
VGHSAGAGGALSVAGALRNFTGTPGSLAEPRPAAFLSFSPQQPGTEGFCDTDFRKPLHSWQPIARRSWAPAMANQTKCDGMTRCNRSRWPSSMATCARTLSPAIGCEPAKDIDEQARLLTVREAVYDGIFATPKTEARETLLDRLVSECHWTQPDVLALLDQVRTALEGVEKRYIDRVASRTGPHVTFVEIVQVTHFYRRDRLTFASTAAKDYAIDMPLSDPEQRLPPERWLRIHRSTIVNVDIVADLQPRFGGKWAGARPQEREDQADRRTRSSRRRACPPRCVTSTLCNTPPPIAPLNDAA